MRDANPERVDTQLNRPAPLKGKVWAEMKDQSVLRDQEEVVQDINMHNISLSLSHTHFPKTSSIHRMCKNTHRLMRTHTHTCLISYYLFLLRHHEKS